MGHLQNLLVPNVDAAGAGLVQRAGVSLQIFVITCYSGNSPASKALDDPLEVMLQARKGTKKLVMLRVLWPTHYFRIYVSPPIP